jgi:hypothetical protein
VNSSLIDNFFLYCFAIEDARMPNEFFPNYAGESFSPKLGRGETNTSGFGFQNQKPQPFL